ncbi:MAG: protein-disulfide reductase DsbD domain-containing protein [Pseudomonadota bacterium]
MHPIDGRASLRQAQREHAPREQAPREQARRRAVPAATLAATLALAVAALGPARSDAEEPFPEGAGWRVATGAIASAGLVALGPERAALRIAAPPGWKTFWRLPGGAGLPPRLDWSRSENLARVDAVWPAAAAFESFGARSVGYAGVVDVAVQATPADPERPVRLRLRIDYAVCREICVPEFAELAVEPPSAPRRDAASEALRRAHAAARRPQSAASLGLSAECAVAPAADGGAMLRIRLSPADALSAPFVVIERRPADGGAGREAAHGSWRAQVAPRSLQLETRVKGGAEGPLRAHLFDATHQVAPIDCVVR